MSIEPRLMERRQTVAEDRAQRALGRLMRMSAVVAILGALTWLALSPWLSVSQVRTAGIGSSDSHSTLTRHGVTAGTPMIMVRPAQVEEALEADPWVAEARVGLRWPDEVVVQVRERAPVLWVQSSEGWTLHAADGVVLPGRVGPDAQSPRLLAAGLSVTDLEESELVIAAAEFVDYLPTSLAATTILRLESGELWATAAGHEVRLGRPVEMSQKALSLTALLTEDLPPGATIILVAPTHPAVEMP